MWPFDKKLDSEQQAELRDVAATLNDAWDGLDSMLVNLATETIPLHSKCRQAVNAGTAVSATEAQIDGSRWMVDKFGMVLDATRETYESVVPAPWYPKKFRQAYESRVESLITVRKTLGWIEESLQPPALRRDPGRDRANMFASGLNVVTMLIKSHPPLRS